MNSDQALSALSWWREAGVDMIVAEEPRDWLAPESRPVSMPAKAPAPPKEPKQDLPAPLEVFQAWFVDGARLPLGAPGATRVGPAGGPHSKVMVLVDMPTAEEINAGALFSGEVGALFDRMMSAIQLDRSDLYLASLSPIHRGNGRIDAEYSSRLVEIARHHIGLAAPGLLLLFGDEIAKALVGTAVSGSRGKRHEIATSTGKIRTFVTIKPHNLLDQPALKKLAWEDLQQLREELNA